MESLTRIESDIWSRNNKTPLLRWHININLFRNIVTFAGIGQSSESPAYQIFYLWIGSKLGLVVVRNSRDSKVFGLTSIQLQFFFLLRSSCLATCKRRVWNDFLGRVETTHRSTACVPVFQWHVTEPRAIKTRLNCTAERIRVTRAHRITRFENWFGSFRDFHNAWARKLYF